MAVPAPQIITCAQWGAVPPKYKPTIVGRPDKGIVHHTDGHAPHLANVNMESVAGSMQYARELQKFHMQGRGWADSGHNFLVCRNGLILQGRWGTVSAIEHGRMIESAHCPGQNGNPGVEFEHLPGEVPTVEQAAAGIALYAWIFDRCGIAPTALYGHHDFYNTDCPSNLYHEIKSWRMLIASRINHYGRGSARAGGALRVALAVSKEIRGGGKATSI